MNLLRGPAAAAAPDRSRAVVAPLVELGRRPFGWWLVAATTYLTASLALQHRVLPDMAERASGWVSSDSSLFVWWLQWTPTAILGGHNPFFTTWQNAPAGVNAMWNTTVPLLGVIFSPLTATAGPVVSYNVAIVLGPVVTGLACCVALGVFGLSRPARLVAGGMFAFSPFIVAHLSVGHLNLVWSIFPPVLLWVVGRIVLDPARPWVPGIVLGLAAALQIGLYTQTLALGAITLVVVALVAAAACPRRLRALAGPIARAGGVAVAVFVATAAYPLWLVLAGPARPRAPIRDATTTGADAANLLVPSHLSKFGVGTGPWRDMMRGYAGEQGSYLGVLVIGVMIFAVVSVPRPAARITAGTAVALWLLSLGTSLVALNRDVGVPLPWTLITGIPVVRDAEAGRLAPFVALSAVVLVAMVLDKALHDRRWLVLGLVALTALSWAPSDSQQVTSARTPPFFASGAPLLQPGEIVEIVPRASGAWVGGADPLLWQARAGMTFRQTGGYFIGSDAGHPLLLEGIVTPFQRGLTDPGISASVARADLATRGVSSVVVVPAAVADANRAVAWSRVVSGDPGRFVGGVWLFHL